MVNAMELQPPGFRMENCIILYPTMTLNAMGNKRAGEKTVLLNTSIPMNTVSATVNI